MIVFRATHRDGRPFLGVGLSEENCRRLLDDQPIPIHLADYGLDTDIELFIFGGKTEEGMVARLAEATDLPPAKELPS